CECVLYVEQCQPCASLQDRDFGIELARAIPFGESCVCLSTRKMPRSQEVACGGVLFIASNGGAQCPLLFDAARKNVQGRKARGLRIVRFRRLTKFLAAISPKVDDQRMVLRRDGARFRLIRLYRRILTAGDSYGFSVEPQAPVFVREVQSAIRIAGQTREFGFCMFFTKKILQGKARTPLSGG